MAHELEVWIEGTQFLAAGSLAAYSVQVHPRQAAGLACGRITGTHGAYGLIDPLDFGEVNYRAESFAVPWGGGSVELGFFAEGPRVVNLTILETGTTERKGVASLADWNHRFRPNQAPLILRVKYHDGTAQRDVYLAGRRLKVGGFGSGAGSGAQFKGNWAGGQIRVPLTLLCSYPFWRRYSAQSTTVAINDFATAVTVTVNNEGDVPIGAWIEYTGAGGGALTTLTISNQTTGPEGDSGGTLVWTSAGFANGNYIDWKHTDPAIPSVAVGSVAAGGYIILWPGPNTIQVYANANVADVATIYWRDAWEDLGN